MPTAEDLVNRDFALVNPKLAGGKRFPIAPTERLDSLSRFPHKRERETADSGGGMR